MFSLGFQKTKNELQGEQMLNSPLFRSKLKMNDNVALYLLDLQIIIAIVGPTLDYK